jgi:hypothetical protein
VSRPAQYPPITGLPDACATAWALREQFTRAHAVFVLGTDGEVLQGLVLTGEDHTVHGVLGLAALGPADRYVDRDVLLISVRGDDDLSVVAEADVERFRGLETQTHASGARLLDWLHVSGEQVRTMRLACDPAARPWAA